MEPTSTETKAKAISEAVILMVTGAVSFLSGFTLLKRIFTVRPIDITPKAS